MAEKLMDVSAENFKTEVLNADVPVLVDFWADWCMPCRMISPIIDELSKDYEGKIKFTKANVDNNTQLATDLQILSIPVLIIFKNGKETSRIAGVNPKERIKREIDKALQ